MKFLAPETVNMLIQRAQNGGPYGFQVGDSIKYIIKYKPVPNGGNTGVNGYITDYVPSGLQVIGASFTQPDGFGGYVDVAPVAAGDMANDPACNGKRNCISATPTLPATPLNTGNIGTLAQLYADTGIWYSTDLRTAFNGGPPGASRNNWDLAELAACNAFKGANSPWGTCSPVAGPNSFYTNELQTGGLTVGPWQRIAYPGSHIGTYGLMGDLQASVPTNAGWNLSPANPLPVSTPTTPITIRWANGLNSVGEIKYVSITARIVSLPPGGSIINESEVWGGDVYYWEGGKDNPWKYNNTLVSIANNSALAMVKTPSTEVAQVGDVVSFQISVVNTGAQPQTNVSVVDYINASLDQKGVFRTMVSYNGDASSGGVYTAGPPGNTLGSENITWTIPLLSPGQSKTFTYSVTALDAVLANPGLKAKEAPNEAVDSVVATSNLVPAPGANASASFSIGTFPLLKQTKTVSPGAALPGGTVRYHVQITNTGGGSAGIYRFGPAPGTIAYPVDLAGLPIPTTIQDTLPTGFAYAGNATITINNAPALNWSVSALGQNVTFTIPHTAAELATSGNEIPPGAVVDLYFDVAINAGIAPGVYTNSAFTQIPFNKKPKNKAPKAKDWAKKPLYSINTAPVSVGAVQLSKTATPSSVVNTPAGTSTSYAITVTNNGAVTANGVTITDTLPAGFSYQAGSTSGSAGIGEPTVTGQAVTWPAFALPAGQSRTVVFTANIASTVLPALYWNDVTATASNATIPDLLHTAPVTVTVPGLSVGKSVDRANIVWQGDGIIAQPYPSDTVNYTITVRNSGSGYGTVEVSDQLPSGFFFPVAGTETVTMTVGGIPQVMTRGLTDTYTTYSIYPGSNPANPLIAPGTRTPHWGTFTIPPKQGAQDSVLTITFAARIDMAQTPVIGTTAVTQPGSYTNQVTLAGSNVPPAFIGSPVTIYRPASKWTTTPNVSVNGLIDYYVQIHNRDSYTWSGVAVTDYLGSLNTNIVGGVPAPSGAAFGVGNTAWYAIGTAQPTGSPGTDPAWLAIAPTAGVNTLTFAPAAPVPAGQSLWLAFNVTAPAAVPVPATIHNSIQTLTYTPGAALPITVNNLYDGGLAANAGEDVTLSLTPTIALNGSKSVTPGSLYLYGAASAPGALHYQITLTNPSAVTAATGVLVRDTLPSYLIGGLAAGFTPTTASVSINGGAAVPIVPVAAPVPPAPANSWDLALGAANIIPPLGTAVIDLYASVPLGTPANTYFNSFTALSDPAVPTANIQTIQVGPTAPVVVDPVSITKKTTTPQAVVGGKAYYTITLTNTGNQPITGLNVADAFYTAPGIVDPDFSFGADVSVKLNGTPLAAGTDYTPPLAGAVNPTWLFTTPVPAGTVSTPANLTIDFYANIAPAANTAIIHHDSVTATATAPLGITAIYDGTFVSNTADDVNISAVGISKNVISPYTTVTNTPVGTLTKYLITVSNPSALAATVTADDLFPAGFTLLDAYSATGLTQPLTAPPAAPWLLTTANTAVAPYSPNHPLFDNAGAGFVVPAGQNLYLWLDVAIAGTVLPGTYTNQANVQIGGINVGNFSGAPVSVVTPQLFMSKITTTPNIGKDVYGNYTPAHYKVSVANTGNAAGTGIVLTDTLPAGFSVNTNPIVTLGGTVLTPGVDYTYSFVAPTLTVNTIPASGFTVPAGQQLDIEYDAQIINTTLAGAYVNSATATSTNAAALGPVSAIVTLSDVGLVKTTSTATTIPGGIARYTITLSNHGATAITGVSVSDFLPAGFTYIPGSTLINGIAAADPNLVNGPSLPVWLIASIPAASTTSITFDAQVSTLVTSGVYYNSITAVGNAGAVQFPNPGPTAPVTVQAAQPSLLILKTVTTLSDPVNGTTNPFSIPGSVMQYTLTVTNSGNGSPDANSIAIVDPIPANTALAFDPYAASPVTFTDGAIPSGLTCTFVSLASTTDCFDFSNTAAPYTWTYVPTPTAGIDANVTAIRIKPAGTMAPAVGGNNPSFQARFNVQVK